MLKLIILWKLQRSNHSYKYTVLWFNWKALNWLLSDMFFTIFQYHKQSQHIHNNIKSTSNDNSCHISVVPSRITFKLLQGRGYRLIRSLLLSIFPNQSFTELSIPNCKSYPVLFHLYIMTFSHTCTHIQTHTQECASWGFQRQLTQSTISRAAQKAAHLPGWFWAELPGPSAHRHAYCAAEEIKKIVIWKVSKEAGQSSFYSSKLENEIVNPLGLEFVFCVSKFDSSGIYEPL